MAQELSNGFITFFHNSDRDDGALALTAATTQGWLSPVLQCVDIQRYVPVTDDTGEITDSTPRFYLMLSDTADIVWSVAVPGSEIEEMIVDLILEPGCCISLPQYGRAIAKNGRPVLVLDICGNVSPKFSLIGSPSLDPRLFELSSRALAVDARPTSNDIVCPLRELWENPELRSAPWAVVVRIVHIGRQRRVLGDSDRGGGKMVFDARLVDARGDSAVATFWGKKREPLDVGCVYHLRGGMIKFSDSVPPKPTVLQFGDRAVVSLLDQDSEEAQSIPKVAVNVLSSVADGVRPIAEVLNMEIGETTSILVAVVSMTSVTTCSTRRGRVARRTVSVRDGSGSSIDITLWEAVAEDSQHQLVVGGRYCFKDFSVKMFGTTKILSSRVSSEIVPCDEHGMATEQPQPRPVQSLRITPVPVAPDSWFGTFSSTTELPLTMLWVSAVRLPLTYRACPRCGRKLQSCDESVTLCPGCGEIPEAPEYRYMIRMLLSDGLQSRWGCGFNAIGEKLLGCAPGEHVSMCRQISQCAETLVRELLGTPILVRFKGPPAPEGTDDLQIIDVAAADPMEAVQRITAEISQLAAN